MSLKIFRISARTSLLAIVKGTGVVSDMESDIVDKYPKDDLEKFIIEVTPRIIGEFDDKMDSVVTDAKTVRLRLNNPEVFADPISPDSRLGDFEST